MNNTSAVMKIMEGLAGRSRDKLARVSRGGRVGMLFAEIKDADGNRKGEPGFRARVEQILYLARAGEAEKYYGFGAIQMALAVRAWDIWEKLWREKYPDRGDEWERGYDHHLMRLWRERVRELFAEHHQERMIPMPLEEYVSRLLDGDLNEETAGELAAFFHKAFHE
ncbi:MAG: hypothetical protein P9M08_07750 [Candidatus Erginobacter occultus]|nr:hypothetical protein [Candidatus Erginobacter occultus]